jgi:uncharacterized phiE125 gp8 family phage protein
MSIDWAWGWNPPLVGEPFRSIFAPPRRRMACIKRPTVPPLSLEEVVLHLRLDPNAKDGPEKPLLEHMIAAATRTLENYASIAVMEQDWRLTLRHWPIAWTEALEIPLPPFKELLRIRVNDAVQDLSEFQVIFDEVMPSRMVPVSGLWRQVAIPRRHDAIIIEYRCGVETPDEVSPSLRQALLMAIGTWYENRESVQQFSLTPMIQIGWRDLLEPYREPGFA